MIDFSQRTLIIYSRKGLKAKDMCIIFLEGIKEVPQLQHKDAKRGGLAILRVREIGYKSYYSVRK